MRLLSSPYFIHFHPRTIFNELRNISKIHLSSFAPLSFGDVPELLYVKRYYDLDVIAELSFL